MATTLKTCKLIFVCTAILAVCAQTQAVEPSVLSNRFLSRSREVTSDSERNNLPPHFYDRYPSTLSNSIDGYAFCQGLTVPTHKSGDGWRESEWALGQRLAASAEMETTLISDPHIIDYVVRIVERLAYSSALTGCFTVKVINDVEPNAYSFPGGFLYVTTGLIWRAANESELSAALAHELGHVMARHLTRIDRKRRIWGTVILAGGPAGYGVRRLFGQLLTLKLLRNAEIKADELSLRYQSAAGYDPCGLGNLLRDVFRQEDNPSFWTRLLDAHPPQQVRMSRLDLIRQQVTTDNIRNYVSDSPEFHQVKAWAEASINMIEANR